MKRAAIFIRVDKTGGLPVLKGILGPRKPCCSAIPADLDSRNGRRAPCSLLQGHRQ